LNARRDGGRSPFAGEAVTRYAALLLVLLIAACGGGNTAADSVTKEEAYIPDFSTPEGASEAFARAIETGNSALLAMALQDAERDAVLARYERNFALSRQGGFGWRVESVTQDNELIEGVEARIHFRYLQVKDGKDTGEVHDTPAVFVRQGDVWKYSEAATERWVAGLLAKKRPANSPPPDSNSGD